MVLALAAGAGCGHPSAANIELRKENQQLHGQIDQLQRDLSASRASIRALESRATTVPILPSDQLDRLFTAESIKFGTGTGPTDVDVTHPGLEGVKVSICPFDQSGQPIKAAGTFTIDAFDLAVPDHPHIGHWVISPEEAGKSFFSMLTLYTYVFNLPWQQLPTHPRITLRVKFDDLLTHRTLLAEKVINVDPKSLSLPTTKPAH